MKPTPSGAVPAVRGGAARDGWRDRLSGSALRWWTGVFCSFVGAFMVVAPQEFRGAVYRAIELRPVPTGFAFLLAGGAMLAAAAIRPRRPLRIVAHLAAAAVLSLLGGGFLLAGGWGGAAMYFALVAGLLASAGEPTRPRGPRAWKGDLLSFVLGIAGTLAGVLQLSMAAGLFAPIVPADRVELLLVGSAMLLTSPYLALLQLRREPASTASEWAAHSLAGAAFLLVTFTMSLPSRAWTGLAMYGSGGVVVALLPWLRRRFREFDPGALRTRLALAFAAATTLALIATVAVLTAESEQATQAEAAEARRESALTVARNVADYLELVAARNASLAAAASRRTITSEQIGELLVQAARDHPRISALGVFTPGGVPIARTGRRTIPRMWATEIIGSLTAEPEAGPVQRLFRDPRGTILLAASPIYGAEGSPTAVMITGYDTQAVLRRLSQEGLAMRLLDEAGRTIASEEGSPRGDDREPVIVATAPVADLGWTVVAEQTETAVLAGVRRERLTAFLLLVGMVLLSIVLGSVAARYIARPLQGLADAVDRVAAGDEWRPLMPTGISELDRLSANFRDMRDRLTARTAERERLAEELRARADALADSDRRKDEFLAMLSHELRNPLGAISSAAYLLEQVSSDDPRVQRTTGVIRRQMRHLIRMVDDLLDVSRITRGKVGLRRAEVELGEIVERAAETAQPLMKAAGHRLTIRRSDERVVLFADSTRLEQVLGNLLRNAAKYTPHEGHVELEAGREGDQAVLRVRDDGMGIAPELLPRIFELFAQGEQTLDRAGGGLGIGLTLVRQLVALHGGTVEARSPGVGRGSEFTVRLPLGADAALDETAVRRARAVAVGQEAD